VQRIGAVYPVTVNSVERHTFMNRRDFLKTSTAALASAGFTATGTRLAAQVPTNGRRSTDVVIFLYDRMTALDAIGPYEVLRCVPGVRVRFVAKI
jgi:uncharacterized protein (DUF1501 family)